MLGKPMIDHLHLNFISTIHTSAFTVLREHVERNPDDKQKPRFEEICEVCEFAIRPRLTRTQHF